MTEKEELIDSILSQIAEDPFMIAISLLEQIILLREKNNWLAESLAKGIPRTPANYAKYHGLTWRDCQ